MELCITVPNLLPMKNKYHVFFFKSKADVFSKIKKKLSVKCGIKKKITALLGYNLHTT